MKTYESEHSSETPCAKEPMATYQRTDPATYRENVYQVTDSERKSIMLAKEQYARGEYYTESEMDKIVAEWLN